VFLAWGFVREGFVGDDVRKRGIMLGDRAIRGDLGRKGHVELGMRHDNFYDISKDDSRVPFVVRETFSSSHVGLKRRCPF